jgi:hypothetical protein
MASIDHYKHKLLGFIECPSTSDFVYLNPTREIPVYQLLEDIPKDEIDFDGKHGDILLGGGSGEAPALRISIEKCLRLFMLDETVDFDHWDELFKAFWTPTESFIFGEGFSKVGWTTDKQLEAWLAENICKIVSHEFEEFKEYKMVNIERTAIKWRRA